MTENKKSKARPYLVFSTTRDIFFGWSNKTGPRMELTNARRIYYYSTHLGIGGPDQLATLGPARGSKIGPTVRLMAVENVANSVLCTDKAATEFRGESWIKP